MGLLVVGVGLVLLVVHWLPVVDIVVVAFEVEEAMAGELVVWLVLGQVGELVGGLAEVQALARGRLILHVLY